MIRAWSSGTLIEMAVRYMLGPSKRPILTSLGESPAQPARAPLSPTTPGMSVREPYTHLAWCSKENPDDTGLLVAGGSPTTNPVNGLTFIDFGPTPIYQTATWDQLANHFRSPKRVHVLPTPPNAQVLEYISHPTILASLRRLP